MQIRYTGQLFPPPPPSFPEATDSYTLPQRTPWGSRSHFSLQAEPGVPGSYLASILCPSDPQLMTD